MTRYSLASIVESLLLEGFPSGWSMSLVHSEEVTAGEIMANSSILESVRDLASMIETTLQEGIVWYHGTPEEGKAKSIIANGIRPGEFGGGRSFQAPVTGRIYLSPSLSYAIIYALGGDITGSKYTRGQGYGYVFVITDSSINENIQPDEDSVGEALALAILKAGLPANWRGAGNRPVLPDEGHIKYYSDSFSRSVWNDRTLCYQLQGSALNNGIAISRLKRLADGEAIYAASVGKQMLRGRMLGDEVLNKLIEYGANVAFKGSITPSEAWRINKDKGILLKRDGSNFFEIAERVL